MFHLPHRHEKGWIPLLLCPRYKFLFQAICFFFLHRTHSSCSVVSHVREMTSAKDSLTKTKSYETPETTTTSVYRARALSVGSQPRCSSAKPSYIFEGRRRFRSQSESICPLGTLRSTPSLECHISSGQEVWKLPVISGQTVKSNNFVDITPDASTVPQRRRSCVLPDLSRGQEETKFRATRLRQEHVEQADNGFDASKSKSQNLAKWLRDQPQL